MTSFEEIGKYLDKLQLEKKFDLMTKIAEDLLFPQIFVTTQSKPDRINWESCSPKLNYDCVLLSKENVDSVRAWMTSEGNFEYADASGLGITTEHGDIHYGEWIVLESNGAVVFVGSEEFKKDYILTS